MVADENILWKFPRNWNLSHFRINNNKFQKWYLISTSTPMQFIRPSSYIINKIRKIKTSNSNTISYFSSIINIDFGKTYPVINISGRFGAINIIRRTYRNQIEAAAKRHEQQMVLLNKWKFYFHFPSSWFWLIPHLVTK